MDVQDFLGMVKKLETNLTHNTGEPPAILNFGLRNSEYQSLKEKERSQMEVKRTDFKKIIETSARLLPSWKKRLTGEKKLYSDLEKH